MFLQQTSPHLKQAVNVSDIMRGVNLALLPGIAIMTWLYGWGVLHNLLLCIVFALFFEIIMLKLRQRPVSPYISDYSAVLTAALLALSLPSLAPWWLSLIGAFFAIVVTKHLYGGLGYNVFNPAMVAYAMLLIAFPEQMSALWQQPLSEINSINWDLWQSLSYQWTGVLPPAISLDALTAATPLDAVRTGIASSAASISEMQQQQIFGYFGGHTVEWINLGFLAGGLWLIYKKYISWHIPLAFIASLFLCALILGSAVDPDRYPSPFFHLFSGATMLGAFFIATDPVTSATTNRGKLIFGAGCGVLVYIIRTWGGYPDAVAFAVILMNISVPLLDYYTQPRVYGHKLNSQGKVDD